MDAAKGMEVPLWNKGHEPLSDLVNSVIINLIGLSYNYFCNYILF